MIWLMRTTLDIDADILDAAKDIARRSGKSAGRVISDLTRQALLRTAPPAQVDGRRTAEPPVVYGFQPFAGRGAMTPCPLVTNELVNRLRDEEGI